MVHMEQMRKVGVPRGLGWWLVLFAFATFAIGGWRVVGRNRQICCDDMRVKYYDVQWARLAPGGQSDPKAAMEEWIAGSQEMDADKDAGEAPFDVLVPGKARFRVIVMTMNRAKSLQRLLDSIEATDFQGDQIALDIWIDRAKNGYIDENVIQLCRNFKFTKGRKFIYKRKENAGLFRQWVFTWTPSSAGENAILLEDDLEVSPYFYKWLKLGREKYKNRAELASFTLQRAGILCSSYKGSMKIKVPRDYPVFFYKLVGSWGHSPNRQHWLEFAKFFREKAWDYNFHPYVEGLVMTDWYKSQEGAGTMWTMFYIYWCEHNNYYNAYVNLAENRTLASNWQEAGLHYNEKQGPPKPDFPLLSLEDDSQFPTPEEPIKVNWHGYVVGGGDDPAIIGKNVLDL